MRVARACPDRPVDLDAPRGAVVIPTARCERFPGLASGKKAARGQFTRPITNPA